jgi:predicted ATPase
VVDDLHEADAPSLDVVRYLARVARQRGWLLAAAAREEELQADGRVARALDSMLREGVCDKLELPRLSPAEAHELVRALCLDNPIGDDLAAAICAQAGGNPRFIEALVEDVPARTAVRLANNCRSLESVPRSPVPARVRFAVAMHLRGLDVTARRILAVAAAAGSSEIPLEGLLGAAAALEAPIPPAAVFEALDRALSFRILEESGRGYAFCHPLVRSVLCRELSRHRREELQAAWTRREGDRTRRLALTASR